MQRRGEERDALFLQLYVRNFRVLCESETSLGARLSVRPTVGLSDCLSVIIPFNFLYHQETTLANWIEIIRNFH